MWLILKYNFLVLAFKNLLGLCCHARFGLSLLDLGCLSITHGENERPVLGFFF